MAICNNASVFHVSHFDVIPMTASNGLKKKKHTKCGSVFSHDILGRIMDSREELLVQTQSPVISYSVTVGKSHQNSESQLFFCRVGFAMDIVDDNPEAIVSWPR